MDFKNIIQHDFPAFYAFAGLIKVPWRYSSKALWSSSSVFMTIGPRQATGSPIGIPETSAEDANRLCKVAVEALNCFDHVRVDMRFDAHEHLRIIEVNGIPGLKPIKSWSPQMYTLYHGSGQDPMGDYQQLVHRIVESGLERYRLV